MDEDFDIRQEQLSSSEKEFENALRPLTFHDFSGQQQVVENLEVFVEAAKYRGEPLDHVLLHGPPGLGKTTLSNIIANELGVGFKITSGPVLDKPGDLAGILTSLEKNDVLFIDEIHRLSPVVEEYLYSSFFISPPFRLPPPQGRVGVGLRGGFWWGLWSLLNSRRAGGRG